MIANSTWGNAAKRATGVSIYFPRTREDYSPDYDALEMSKDARWMSFIKAYQRAVDE